MTFDPGPALEAGSPAAETDSEFSRGEPGTIFIGGDTALTPAEANAVTSASESTVVLIAGEASAGKSTLVVQLFGQFLTGPFGGWSFAGSRTLRALDIVHRDLRLSSGNTVGQVQRTQAEDMRLLHLDLAKKDRRLSLLLSDVRGEYFEALADGSDVQVAAPLAQRADLCVVVVDGDRLVDEAQRRLTIWRTQQLVGALTEPGGLPVRTPTLFVVSKSDVLPTRELGAILAQLQGDLEILATERGLIPSFVATSALPADGSKPHKIRAALDWLTESRIAAVVPFSPDRKSGRMAWRAEVES